MQYPAGSIEVRGASYEVSVDDSGNWTAGFDGQTYYGDTREQLYAKLMTASRKAAVKVAIPFTLITGHRLKGQMFREGVATGLHAGNGNIMVRYGSKTEQLGSYRTTPSDHGFGYYRPLSEADRDELIARMQVLERAQQAVKAFAKEHGIDLREEIIAAIDKGVAEQT